MTAEWRRVGGGWAPGQLSGKGSMPQTLKLILALSKVSGKDEPDWGGKMESHQVTFLLESPPPTDSTARLQPLLWGDL